MATSPAPSPKKQSSSSSSSSSSSGSSSFIRRLLNGQDSSEETAPVLDDALLRPSNISYALTDVHASASSSSHSDCHSSSSSSSAASAASGMLSRILSLPNVLSHLTSPGPRKAKHAHSSGSNCSSSSSSSPSAEEEEVSRTRNEKFQKLLSEPITDIEAVRKLSWSGIPPHWRPFTWQLLTGYIACAADRREATIKRKREEYRSLCQDHLTFLEDPSRASEYEQHLWHQIAIDVPRTNPDMPFLQGDRIQRSFERILYVWSIRHPGSGYVQGLNDVVTPFVAVFLGPHIDDGDVLNSDLSHVSDADFADVEADSFWCFSKLLDSIQDHYVFAQPGIQRMVFKLKELTQRTDPELHDHLEKTGLEFLQFAFRWINCLLIRELPMRLIIRLWDTYLAEGESFANLHVYVCLAYLSNWSTKLRSLDFQGMVFFLQSPPTKHWSYSDIEVLLSRAFVLQQSFEQFKTK